jgi:hypothetical protein
VHFTRDVTAAALKISSDELAVDGSADLFH